MLLKNEAETEMPISYIWRIFGGMNQGNKNKTIQKTFLHLLWFSITFIEHISVIFIFTWRNLIGRLVNVYVNWLDKLTVTHKVIVPKDHQKLSINVYGQ